MSGESWTEKIRGGWLAAVKFLREVVQEVHPVTGKVNWPNRETIISSTTVVIVIVVVVALYLSGLDFVFGKLRNLLIVR